MVALCEQALGLHILKKLATLKGINIVKAGPGKVKKYNLLYFAIVTQTASLSS